MRNFQDHFNTLASQPAWRTQAGTLTYRQLESRVRCHASLLRKHGAQAGDHWTVHGWPALDTFALLLAAMWQRVTLFPLPDRLSDALREQMMQQIPRQGSLDLGNLVIEPETPGVIDCDENAPAIGVFTSGSTGQPKAVMHSWKSLAHSAWTTNQFYKLQAADAWLLSLDIAHIGGLQIAVRCFLGNAITWHLTEPNAVAAVLRAQSPAYLSLVPTQLYRLMGDSEALLQLRRCKAIVLGGAAASAELMDQATEARLPVSVSYGSSETAAQCAALPPGTRPLHAGDVGQLFLGWEYQHAVETLRLRGPAASSGFYQQQKFHKLQDAEGWMTLPDRILCNAGRLTLLGRVDGIFQVAGENVSPMDIVQPLECLRQDADFLALPWPDAEYGAVPILIIRSVVSPAVDSIVEILQKHLSGVQRPRRIYWHQSDEISKPSRSYYEQALERQEIPLVWRQDLGRI